jgi:hypothetical protein
VGPVTILLVYELIAAGGDHLRVGTDSAALAVPEETIVSTVVSIPVRASMTGILAGRRMMRHTTFLNRCFLIVNVRGDNKKELSRIAASYP